MRGAKQGLSLLLLFPLSLFAKANGGTENNDQKGTELAINGYVTDADSKKPVQGVTVSISNINAQKKIEKKEFTTDASGNFRVPSMASGGVTIVLEKRGYKTVRKKGIIVREGETLKLNLDIDSEGQGEEVFHPLLRMMEGI